MCNSGKSKCGCSGCTCQEKLPEINLLSFKILSTGTPEQKGEIFAIGALVKDAKGSMVDRFVGRCPTKEKHSHAEKIFETHENFFDLAQSFSSFCKKHSQTCVILWGVESTEVIFIIHLMKYNLLAKDFPIIVVPFVPSDPLMFAVQNGIKGTEDPKSIFFVPEVVISHFLATRGKEGQAVEKDLRHPTFFHPPHPTTQ